MTLGIFFTPKITKCRVGLEAHPIDNY